MIPMVYKLLNFSGDENDSSIDWGHKNSNEKEPNLEENPAERKSPFFEGPKNGYIEEVKADDQEEKVEVIELTTNIRL
jgi:hypothetical protein